MCLHVHALGYLYRAWRTATEAASSSSPQRTFRQGPLRCPACSAVGAAGSTCVCAMCGRAHRVGTASGERACCGCIMRVRALPAGLVPSRSSRSVRYIAH